MKKLVDPSYSIQGSYFHISKPPDNESELVEILNTIPTQRSLSTINISNVNDAWLNLSWLNLIFKLPLIKNIHIDSPRFTSEGWGTFFQLLDESVFLNLIESVFIYNGLVSHHEMSLLSRFLLRCPNLNNLNLSGNSIDPSTITLILPTLVKLKKLTYLNLDNNFLSCDGLSLLANRLHEMKSLVCLYLNYNFIGDAGAYAIADALSRNISISVLHLSLNKIGDEGIIYLSNSIKSNGKLLWFFIDNNSITGVGLSAFFKILNTQHHLLEISIHNNVTCEPIEYSDAFLNRLVTNQAIVDKKHEFIRGLKDNLYEHMPCQIPINSRSSKYPYETALHIAVKQKNTSLIKSLIGQGYSLYLKNAIGQTPLMLSEMEDMLFDIDLFAKQSNKIQEVTACPSIPSLCSDALSVLQNATKSVFIEEGIIELGEFIAKGGTSTINLGFYKKRKVAIKSLLCIKQPDDFLILFAEEAIKMMTLSHENIIKTYGVYVDQNYRIVMEYVAQKNLQDILYSNTRIEWHNLIQIAIGIANGVTYLHLHNIVHRDVKSSNIVLGKDFLPKLIDFGWQKSSYLCISESELDSNDSSLPWFAPECIITIAKNFSFASDVYSVGVVLWELIARKPPYSSCKKFSDFINVHLTGKQQKIPYDTQEKYADIIRSCWIFKPTSRPKISSVAERLRQIL